MVGKKLSDLRVVDLKAELERRGLDKSGIKAQLVERLTQALEGDGVSVDDFIIGSNKETEAANKSQSEVKSETDDGVEEQEDSKSEKMSVDNVEVEDECSGTASTEAEVMSAEIMSAESDPSIVKSVIEDAEETSVSANMIINDDDMVEVEANSVLKSVKDDEESPAVPEENDGKETVVITKETEEIEESTNTVSLPEKICEVNEESKKTNDSDGVPEDVDDHDALHLTIEEEMDKFMMDDETDDGNFEDTSSTPVDDDMTEAEKGNSVGSSEESHSTTNSQEAGKAGTDSKSRKGYNQKSKFAETQGVPESNNNEKRSSSKEAKGIDKSSEGRTNRKSKEEDRNTLLVTGLSSQTTATDLKAVFKKHGKIGGVKIMSNAKDPEGTRFALVAVLSPDDVMTCIKKLDGIDLHGRIIHVDKAGAEMLSAEWSRKEVTRDPIILSDKKEISSEISGLEAAKDTTSGKTTPNEKQILEQMPNIEKGTKKGSEKSSADQQGTSKLDSRKKSGTNGTDKASEKNGKSKQSTTSDEKKKTELNVVKDKKVQEKKDKKVDLHPRYHPGRGGRSRDFRHNTGFNRDRPRGPHFREERGKEFVRRFPGSRGGFGRPSRAHERSPPTRIPYRRLSADARRGGRQPELTFEDIYDIRQREKGREIERERREIERRRMEEEEKQRMLDQEIRLLAKQRERIELEKLELKRQKERMIMEEREKQRLERDRLQREKEDLTRRLEESRRGAKRSHPEESFDSVDRKKLTLDDRSRHSLSYADSHSRSDKEKVRSDSYRRGEPGRFGGHETSDRRSLTPVRGAPIRSAPIRDVRPPSWETDRRRARGRSPELSGRREREPAKSSRSDSRRDELKLFQELATVPTVGTRYSHDETSHYSPSTSSTWGRHTEAKSDAYSSSNGRDSRNWSARSAPSYSAETSSSQLTTSIRSDSWQTSRENLWMATERVSSRPVSSEMSDRWVSGSGTTVNGTGRVAVPVAPPPPIFSNPTGGTLTSGHPSLPQAFVSSRGYDYEYKLPSSSSQRR